MVSGFGFGSCIVGLIIDVGLEIRSTWWTPSSQALLRLFPPWGERVGLSYDLGRTVLKAMSTPNYNHFREAG